MRKGTVVCWNENRGIGVIHEDYTKQPIIVHYSAIKDQAGIKNLEVDREVLFTAVFIEGKQVADFCINFF